MESLANAQQAQAQKLAQAIAQARYEDTRNIARTLVVTDNASLFGDTTFTVRDLSQRIAAKAYRQHLEQKKRLPRGQRNLPSMPLRRAYHGDRRHRLVGLCGEVCCQRAYYYCRRCG